MKALKGVLIYIGIILGIVLGIGLILLCVMYFVPSVRIFGVGLVHYNKVVDQESIAVSKYSAYSNVELNINSGNINVNIVPTEESDLNFSLKLNIFGVSSEIVEYRVTKNCTTDSGVLKISLNVTEPKGWIATNDSALTVKIPAGKKYSLYTTTNSGDISIGASKTAMQIYGINISTGTGDLAVTNLGEGSENKTLNLKSLNLTTNKGVFDLSSITNINVDNKMKLVANDGRFKFENLNASLDISGDGVRIDAKEIACGDTEGMSAILKNGYFNISTLSCNGGGEITIITDNTSFNVTEITGKTGIVTSYGDIKINKLNGYAMIENTNGRVTIGRANEDIIIKTTMGDISVDSYYKSGKFTSKKGNITVESKSDYASDISTEINNEDGKVIVYNEINLLTINTNGKSRVEVVFRKIKSGFTSVNNAFQHQIKVKGTGSGFVRIPTLDTIPFMFVATGQISGELAGFTNDNNYSSVESKATEQYYPNSSRKSETTLNASFLFEGKIELAGYSQA